LIAHFINTNQVFVRLPQIDGFDSPLRFGGTFGVFETEDCHFFDANHPTYLRIAAIAKIRNGDNKIGLALRRGRQYLRQTSVSTQTKKS
jgi:hypothetical protein